MEHIGKVLKSSKKKRRKILKCLFLIEHIIKTGNMNFVEKLRDEHEYKLKSLSDFSYIDENRADKGETSKIFI